MTLPQRWESWLDESARTWREQDLERRLSPVCWTGPVTAKVDDRDVVLFSTNDYLGYSAHPRVREALASCAGQGPRAAALISGHTDEHEALRREIAQVFGAADALLFPTGFAANLGALTALLDEESAVYSDALNHASIVDGCRLAKSRGAGVHVFPHRDVAHLDEKLARETRRAVVVTDGVFSMDGDAAPVDDLAAVCRRHGALLIVDEAHAFLTHGVRGGGVSEDHEGVHVRIATLSKAAASMGGVVAGDAAIIGRLVQKARSFVFSTALTLPVVRGARAALAVRRDDGGASGDQNAVGRLRENIERLRAVLGSASRSAIHPVVVGDEAVALDASRKLLAAGLHVPAVRPPTVPAGTARLRISLSAAHTAEHMELLSETLFKMGLADR